jgi:hypothetical protein
MTSRSSVLKAVAAAFRISAISGLHKIYKKSTKILIWLKQKNYTANIFLIFVRDLWKVIYFNWLKPDAVEAGAGKTAERVEGISAWTH